MSEYRDMLQTAMIASSQIKQSNNQTIKQFYTVCETLAYAAFLTGWALCIICHI